MTKKLGTKPFLMTLLQDSKVSVLVTLMQELYICLFPCSKEQQPINYIFELSYLSFIFCVWLHPQSTHDN